MSQLSISSRASQHSTPQLPLQMGEVLGEMVVGELGEGVVEE